MVDGKFYTSGHFVTTKHKLGFEKEIPAEKTMEMMQKFLRSTGESGVSMASRAFIFDVDFTADLAIGFDPNLLETHWQTEKAKGNLIGYDRPSTFCLKAFKSSFPARYGNHKNYERKVYNKFAYYLLVGGTIIDKVASSLSKQVANRSKIPRKSETFPLN
jgi:hypothetical protein